MQMVTSAVRCVCVPSESAVGTVEASDSGYTRVSILCLVCLASE